MRNRIKILLFIAFFGVGSASAQITGPNPTNAGSTQTYVYGSSMISSPFWSISNGTLISSTAASFNYTANIAWSTTASSGSIVLRDGATVKATLTVNLTPIAPTATDATNVAPTSFTANWNSVSTATSYLLYVSLSNTFSSHVTGYNGASVSGTTFSVTGLSHSTPYFYRVKAVNSNGSSQYSNFKPATTTLAPPTALSATAVTTTSFTAQWTSVTGAASYRLDISTVNTFASYIAGYNNLTVTGTSRAVTGLTIGTNYFYRLRTVNSSGVVSVNSNIKDAPTITAAPAATAETNISETGFTANWSSVAGATSYTLEVSIQSNFSTILTTYTGVIGNSKIVTGLREVPATITE
jgi:Fibronectin type III domain